MKNFTFLLLLATTATSSAMFKIQNLITMPRLLSMPLARSFSSKSFRSPYAPFISRLHEMSIPQLEEKLAREEQGMEGICNLFTYPFTRTDQKRLFRIFSSKWKELDLIRMVIKKKRDLTKKKSD